MSGRSHVRRATCEKIIAKGAPKVSAGAGWRCSDCEYQAQQVAKQARPLRRVK